MTVFVYVNAGKQVGNADHIKVFANADAAEKWFEENDPEGVAFEYPVLEGKPFPLPFVENRAVGLAANNQSDENSPLG
jgi:hypothetical protein